MPAGGLLMRMLKTPGARGWITLSCVSVRGLWLRLTRLSPTGVVEAVVDGIQAGRGDYQQPVNLIGILSRTYGAQAGEKELKALLSQRDAIVALDLAGDEAHFPGALFDEHFKLARQAGWQITVHAGEIEGPESIWQAVRGLKAARLGHAVRAVEDAALLDTLRDERIGMN